MHVTFLNNLYPPYVVGGNEMQLRDVVTALRKRGHRVSIVCGRGARLPDDPDLLGVLDLDLDRRAETFYGGRLPTPWEAFEQHLFNPRSFQNTARALATLAPDVVVAWNLHLASVSPILAAQRGPAPVVVHLFDKWLYYDLVDLAARLGPKVPWKRLAVRTAEVTVQPVLRRLVDPRRFIAVSAFMKGFYVHAGFDGRSIDVEPLGVPTGFFTKVARPPKAPGEPLRLLFVGTLWEGKGPLTALHAHALLLGSGISAHLDVCGDGGPGFVRVVRELIETLGISQSVSLHGQVAPQRVRDLCHACDVFVFPSEWDEPFAAAPLEAMSCGMAVVATTTGGTPEAVADGRTGLLVPPRDPQAMADALRRLAKDDRLRLSLGENAAAAVRERFDFDTWVDRLEARYASVAGARGASAPTTPR